TPHAWLVRLRLERACAALATERVSVAQVAADVGFYDQSHFNRAFRMAYGAPPSAYQPAA
ncbi:MAG: helix-turn-helix transcriptional regulator, partial [Achromobacter sp.]